MTARQRRYGLSKLRRLRDGEPRVVDLFAGCGGMSLGFRAAGCQVVAGIEKEEVRARTHARNFHRHLGDALEREHGIPHDVTDPPLSTLQRFTGSLVADVDILVGGPPCQAYARVGRAKLREIAKHPTAFLQDDRGQLYAAYMEWVRALAPTIVVMENVPDILRYGDENVAETIAENLEEAGYVARYTLLNAAAYGVPQTRERWFLLAVRREAGIVPSFPLATHRVELPIGYRGTRAEATRWSDRRPPHALPIPGTVARPKAAVTCAQALEDLPVIPEEAKYAQRGRRDLDAIMSYRCPPGNAYQRQMRTWSGFRTSGGVTAHVIRSLPRDYETFRRMKEGDDYPKAFEVAEGRFAERVEMERSHGRVIREGSKAWRELREEIVPPYDASKFPNKWWKLRRDLPSRTLMAHLSHDSYSHIHYDDRQARTISVREAARLQSFPDGFMFEGAMNAAFGQIGNAVPPLLAQALAEHVLGEVRQTREQPAEIASSG